MKITMQNLSTLDCLITICAKSLQLCPALCDPMDYSPCGGGNDNPLQYPCLENPMDRGAWWGCKELDVSLSLSLSLSLSHTHTHTHTPPRVLHGPGHHTPTHTHTPTHPRVLYGPGLKWRGCAFQVRSLNLNWDCEQLLKKLNSCPWGESLKRKPTVPIHDTHPLPQLGCSGLTLGFSSLYLSKRAWMREPYSGWTSLKFLTWNQMKTMRASP